MPDVVHGSKVLVELSVDSVYYPVLCGTDCSFTRTPEFIGKTGPTSGLFREFAVRIEEWSISVSGLTKIDNAATLTFFYLLQTAVRRAEHLVRITFEDDQGNSKQIEGNVLIGQESITGPVSDFANCTIEFKGTGPFDVSAVSDPPPPEWDILSDYWQTVNGDNFIDGVSAIDGYTLSDSTDELLEVSVEGLEYDIVLSTPTAGTRECWFVAPDKVEFPSDLIFDGTQRVTVLFKRD